MLETLKIGLVQFLFGYLFIVGGFLSYFILFILYPLRWVGLAKFYRYAARSICYFHFPILTMVATWLADIEVNLYAHPDVIAKLGKEKAVVVMNHRYHLDWLALWIVSEYFGNLKDFKCLAKRELLWIPVIGQALFFNGSVFLRRDAKSDKDELRNYFKDLKTVPFNYWLLLFSEGTRFTPSKHQAGVEYALSKGLKPLTHHLMPRTKGFSLVCKGLDQQVPALYDMTAICPNNENPPLSTFTRCGRAKVDILLRRIPFDEVPVEEEESARYLENLYRSKDEICDFYTKNQRFPLKENNELKEFVRFNIPRTLSALLIVFGWGMLLLPPLLNFVIPYVSGISVQTLAVLVILILPLSLLRRYILFASTSSSAYGQRK